MKRIISTEQAPKAIGPYSQAVEAGGFLFVSGQLGIDPKTGKFAEGVEAQARQSMENIGSILKEAGLDFSNVVRAGIYVNNMEDFQRVNEVYAGFFSGSYPARATVEAGRLPRGAAVEIEAVAVVG